jgi:glycosyltransferase involved in cell wall biosynthesis
MKGFDLLIKAIAELGDGTVRLSIAGEGGERRRLENLARTCGVEDRVTLLGHVEDIRRVYARADCLAVASVNRESFGQVLIEAMACGLPVVTSDFGPLPEINVDGRTGLVVPAGDVPALAAAIRRLANDPALCRKMGDAGRERVQRHFTRERMLAESLRLYALAVYEAHGTHRPTPDTRP